MSFLYMLFRDTIGRGSSPGKRAVGLVVIDVESGRESSGARVWLRDFIDMIPFVNLVDFLGSCMDMHGQKMMDKKLKTQVVERNPIDETIIDTGSSRW
jgi:uncharacterized RDD family membrane protein YckC